MVVNYSILNQVLLPLKQYCRSVVQSWFKFVEMSQNGPFFGHPSCNIALKEAKLGQNRVQKWCARTAHGARTDGRTHIKFLRLPTQKPFGQKIEIIERDVWRIFRKNKDGYRYEQTQGDLQQFEIMYQNKLAPLCH